MSGESQHVTVRLVQRSDFQFEVDYGGATPPLVTDEPAPLGAGAGPSPIQLLATAVGDCLSSSLLFALRKFKQQPEPIVCDATAEVGRNAEGRLRVLGIDVRLKLGKPSAELQHLDRVLDQFENFCTVTQSVRGSIDVRVQVEDAAGVRLK